MSDRKRSPDRRSARGPVIDADSSEAGRVERSGAPADLPSPVATDEGGSPPPPHASLASGDPLATMRVDKWLWQARFFKTRSRAAAVVSGGHLRVNGQRAAKPAQPIRSGDVLTFVMGQAVRVVRVRHLSGRRGPAPEARLLYEDLTPEAETDPARLKPRQGRPSREDRRIGRLSKEGPLE